MYYVYILHDKNSNFYIGYSEDLKKRLEEHKNGLVYATAHKLPIRLIYYEACISRYDAVKREKYLKSGSGRRYIRNRLKNYFKKSGLGPVRSLVIKGVHH